MEIRRQPLPRDEPPEQEDGGAHGGMLDTTLGCGVAKPLMAAVIFALALLLVVLSGARRSLSFDVLRSSYSAPERASDSSCSVDPSTIPPPPRPKDKFLGGLLSTAFEESACFSRYQSALYRKVSNYTPSPYLVDVLRSYEALHKKCGPNTDLYNQAIEHLKSNRSAPAPAECNYVVWLPADGLGNRLISITSAFLYALLNNKVLLLHLPADMADLFCEPFPDTSWLLTQDFPIDNLDWIFEKHPRSYGNMLKNKVLSNDMDTTNASLPAYLYLHLLHANDDFDKMFYCEEGQRLLQQFQWLLLRSNEYFVPALFFIPEFEEQLNLLFPDKSTVFHHLGRYLFNPTNSVWGYITRYHDAYLANAKEQLGIQIRKFAFAEVDFDTLSSQIINCSLKENLLPGIDDDSALPTQLGSDPKAVLVTSLHGGYFEKLRDLYFEHATTNGEVIGVHQPSHEEHQHTEKLSHNMKAFAEIYLLSSSDQLITSPFSTFGYVAHGLGGLRPWILVRSDRRNRPCLRSMSMEPCFHFPPSYDCKAKKKVDKGSVVPYVRHCEDFPLGIKLFD